MSRALAAEAFGGKTVLGPSGESMLRTFDLHTHQRDEMVNITDTVAKALAESGRDEGVLTVYVPHTTAAVTVNENADPDVVHDVLGALEKAVPWSQGHFRHDEGNSAAHTKSSLIGCSVSIPFQRGRMALGTWQAVYFCEFDGPRARRFCVSV
jgi:secondary thiamine-phosphate synthase enzyme